MANQTITTDANHDDLTGWTGSLYIYDRGENLLAQVALTLNNLKSVRGSSQVFLTGGRGPAGVAGGIEEAFETVSQNLDSSNASISYDGNGRIDSITYANGITKTISYDGNGRISTITLSGSTPLGIDLTRTMSYNVGGQLTGTVYA